MHINLRISVSVSYQCLCYLVNECLMTDNNLKLFLNEFNNFCKDKDIKRYLTVCHTPQHINQHEDEQDLVDEE